MKSIFLLFVHLVVSIAKLLGPGGAKAIVADSLLTILAVLESLNKLISLSGLPSTKMSSDEYCQHILNCIREMADHHD